MKTKVSVLWPRNKRASFELSPGMAEFGLDISGPDGYGFTDSTWFDGYTYRYFWGEFNTHIYYEGDCYKVADTDRGSRDLNPEVIGESLELVQSWLLVRVGKMYRSLMCLPEIELPYLREQVKYGYDMIEVERSRYSLQRLDGSPMSIVFRDSGPLSFKVVKYSHVADLPLPGLIESYKSETGAPFLQDYVKGGGNG